MFYLCLSGFHFVYNLNLSRVIDCLSHIPQYFIKRETLRQFKAMVLLGFHEEVHRFLMIHG